MSGLDDILKMIPIDQIASRLGVEPAVAKQAVEEGGATILTGLQRNAQSPDGASALAQALGKHGGAGDQIDLDNLDTADGDKILGHVFGDQKSAVEQKLNDEPKTAGIDFGKLLPMLAPIVMGLLAKKQQSSPQEGTSGAGGPDLGGLIGGLLGGGSSGGQGGGGIDIGGLLGGLFGGKS